MTERHRDPISPDAPAYGCLIVLAISLWLAIGLAVVAWWLWW